MAGSGGIGRGKQRGGMKVRERKSFRWRGKPGGEGEANREGELLGREGGVIVLILYC